MKRVLLYIGIAIATIGCAQDADVVTQMGDTPLTITSNIATRVADEQWEKNDPIGVYMTTISDDETLGDIGSNVQYATTNGDGIFTSSATTPLYLPTSGSVKIFAYYPYVEDVDITAYEIKSVGQVDLLSASEDNVTSSSSPVKMTFNHLLSKVSLTIEAGDGLEAADLDNLEVMLSGISTEATFDLEVTNQATTTNSDAELKLTTIITKDSDEGKITAISSSAIVIPQYLTDATLYFTTVKHGTFSATLTTKVFETGTEYTYTATLNDDSIEITEANISSWGDEGEVPGTADLVDIEYKNSDNKYYINSAKGLAAFRDLVNMSGSNSQNATFAGFESDAFASANTGINGVLTRDIDLSDICGADVGSNGTSWSTIGNYVNIQYAYDGIFDGGGYEISGLYINTTLNQQGLFRCIGTNGVVYNLGVSGTATNGCTSTQSQFGSITAYNYGSIFNCYSSVDIDGSNVVNVGGIAGYNYPTGKVVNCYNHGDVTGLVNIGGIVGYNDGYVGYCYNTSEVSTSTGYTYGTEISVTVNDTTTTPSIKYGGVVGYNDSTLSESVKGSFCLNNTEYSIGQVATTTISGTLNTNVCYAEYLTSETFATTMTNGAATYNTNYSPETIEACAWVYNKAGYPTLDFGVVKEFTKLDISYNGISYNINTEMGLQAFAALVNGDAKPDEVITSGNDIYFSFGTVYPNIDGKLTTSIDLDEAAWSPIGNYGSKSTLKYSGTFEGGGYTVSGLSINSTQGFQGLFGYLGTDGVVKNLTVEGDVASSTELESDSTGGIVALNEGLIINCCNYVNVSGYCSVGGIAGENIVGGSIVNSCNHGEVYASGNDVGGVAGYNSATAAAAIYSVYNTGGVSGNGSNIGSVLGDNLNASSASKCYSLKGATTDNYIFGNDNTDWTSFFFENTDTDMQTLSSTLNTNAATYNSNNSSSTQASDWVVVSGGYPTLVYGSISNND